METKKTLIDEHAEVLQKIHEIKYEELSDLEASIRREARKMEGVINDHMMRALDEIKEKYGWLPEDIEIAMVRNESHGTMYRKSFKYGGCSVIGRVTEG